MKNLAAHIRQLAGNAAPPIFFLTNVLQAIFDKTESWEAKSLTGGQNSSLLTRKMS